MPGQIKPEIYTPSGRCSILHGYAALPCSGELGVMYNHRPMIAGLTIGVLRYGVAVRRRTFVSGIYEGETTRLPCWRMYRNWPKIDAAWRWRPRPGGRLRQSLSANDLVGRTGFETGADSLEDREDCTNVACRMWIKHAAGNCSMRLYLTLQWRRRYEHTRDPDHGVFDFVATSASCSVFTPGHRRSRFGIKTHTAWTQYLLKQQFIRRLVPQA